MIKLVLAILAIIFFCLDGFRVANDKVSWTPLGFACVTAAILLPL